MPDLIARAVAPWADHAHRVHPAHYEPGEKSDTNARNAAHEALQILQDGMWHRSNEFGGIVQRHNTTSWGMYRVLDRFGLAQSDSGWYLCIPRDWTPELAPDEDE